MKVHPGSHKHSKDAGPCKTVAQWIRHDAMVHHEVVSQLSHRLRVMRMYRTGLRVRPFGMHGGPWRLYNSKIADFQELLNWSMSRHHWYPRVAALRLEFEENKGVVSLQNLYQRIVLR